MKMLLSTNNNIVYNPFIILFFCGCKGNIFFLTLQISGKFHFVFVLIWLFLADKFPMF